MKEWIMEPFSGIMTFWRNVWHHKFSFTTNNSLFLWARRLFNMCININWQIYSNYKLQAYTYLILSLATTMVQRSNNVSVVTWSNTNQSLVQFTLPRSDPWTNQYTNDSFEMLWWSLCLIWAFKLFYSSGATT